MRIHHARCSVFRVALFRHAFALVVAFYLRRSATLFFRDLGRWIYTPLPGAALALGSWPNRVRRIVDAREEVAPE